MKHHLAVPLLFTVAVLSDAVLAQPVFAWSPAGASVTGGGLGNSTPFWATSTTYQQVHDYAEMLQVGGGSPVIMRGIAFRASKNVAFSARSMDVQVNMGGTSVTSQNISTTFAANLGANPVRVVGDNQTPFQKFSFAALTGTGDPNPPGIVVPFKNLWIWLNAKNNSLCWEWRHKNSTSIASSVLDGFNGIVPGGVMLPSVGIGCTPTGSTIPSRAFVSMAGAFTGSRLTVALQYSAANARAMMMAGIKKQQTVLPGWCSNLELVPLGQLYGQTNASGLWNYQVPVTVFSGVPAFDLLLQYAFLDQGLPGGIGLSDMAIYRTPLGGIWRISRAFNPTSTNASNGNETATVGATSINIGLVTGFQIK